MNRKTFSLRIKTKLTLKRLFLLSKRFIYTPVLCLCNSRDNTSMEEFSEKISISNHVTKIGLINLLFPGTEFHIILEDLVKC